MAKELIGKVLKMAEPAKKMNYPTPAHREADRILGDMALVSAKLKDLERQCKEEMEVFASGWQQKMLPLKTALKLLENNIEKLMKTNRNRFFDGTDRVDLTNGALLFAIISRVKRARKVLENLEKINAEGSAFIISRAVNWETLETWTDERLVEAGTVRVREDKFSWELFEGGKK